MEPETGPKDFNQILADDFCFQSETIEEINIEEIQSINSIPDYKYPTTLPHPIVVKTSEGYYIIEGSKEIDEARKAGNSTITSYIYEMAVHSDIKLALRKAAIRIVSKSGKITYAERIRNTRLIVDEIKRIGENRFVFSHGGARRGDKYTSGKEKDIFDLLSVRFRQGRKTLQQWYSYSEYLKDEVIEKAIELETSREFFEKVQKQKRHLIKSLKEHNKSEEYIEEQVSDAMLRMLDEFNTTGIINNHDADIVVEERQQTDNDNIDAATAHNIATDTTIDPNEANQTEDTPQAPSAQPTINEEEQIENITTNSLGDTAIEWGGYLINCGKFMHELSDDVENYPEDYLLEIFIDYANEIVAEISKLISKAQYKLDFLMRNDAY